MKPLSGLNAALEEIGRRRQEFRAEQITRYGWSDDVTCPRCGDTGRVPPGRSWCSCEAGETRRLVEEAATGWSELCPRRFAGYTLASHPKREAAAAVADWLDGKPLHTGRNLLLAGPVGTGKTGLAIGAVKELYDTGCRWLWFIAVPDLLDQMRPGGDDKALARAKRVPCLVLDDIGVEKGSDWQAERLYVVVNARYETQLPTIITTNRILTDLETLVGHRTVSRLTEDATMVQVAGRDLRRSA